MTYNDVTFMALDRGYQVLSNGESIGTIHQHKSKKYWHGTIGGSINFTGISKHSLVLEMLDFHNNWKKLSSNDSQKERLLRAIEGI